jgi:histidinol-phosphate aminotransferase
MIEPKPLVAGITRVAESEPSRFGQVRLDRSERTHPFTEAFVRRVRERLTGETMMVYPEPGPLYEQVAAWTGQPTDRILFNQGSDQSIKAVYETYVGPGDRVLLHRPGYAMYPVYTRLFGGEPVYADFDSDLRFDWDAYVAMVEPSMRMAVLENPNGFIGSAPPREALAAFIGRCEECGVLAVIDEAYFHFHDVTAADLIDTHENLIVVRTFSKAFGAAGLRAGYSLSQPANIVNLGRVKPMHEINGFAILMIRTLLEDPEELYAFVRETRESLAYLKDGLTALGIDRSDSVGNFLAARFGAVLDCDALRESLREQGILVRRPFREEHLAQWVRIGTAPIPEMRRVLDTAGELIARGKGSV